VALRFFEGRNFKDVRGAGESPAGAGAASQLPLRDVGTGISCCLIRMATPARRRAARPGTMASSPLPFLVHGRMSIEPTLKIAAEPALVTRFRAAGGEARSGQEVLAAAAAAMHARAGVETAGGARESQAPASASPVFDVQMAGGELSSAPQFGGGEDRQGT